MWALGEDAPNFSGRCGFTGPAKSRAPWQRAAKAARQEFRRVWFYKKLFSILIIIKTLNNFL